MDRRTLIINLGANLIYLNDLYWKNIKEAYTIGIELIEAK